MLVNAYFFETYHIIFFYDMENKKIYKIKSAGELLHFLDFFVQNGEKMRFYGFEVYQILKPFLKKMSNEYIFTTFAKSPQSIFRLDFLKNDTCFFEFIELSYLIKNPFDVEDNLPISKNLVKADFEIMENLLQEKYRLFNFEIEEIGNTIFSDTSILKKWMRENVSSIKINKKSLAYMYNSLSRQNRPKNFETWALRKACFRAGLSFINTKYAGQALENIYNYDIKSAYHAFMNVLSVPRDFRDDFLLLKWAVKKILKQKKIKSYARAFDYAIHANITFKNLRLKKNTVFARDGIAILSEQMFVDKIKFINDSDFYLDVVTKSARQVLKDEVVDGVFAFSKLYSAKEVTLNITEFELYIIKHVYNFDSYIVNFGEVATRFCLAPDKIALSSNMLFGLKEKNKDVYKKMYNSLFGLNTQDYFYPVFEIENGDLILDDASIPSFENFENLDKNTYSQRLFHWGIRIAGVTRLYLVQHIEALAINAHVVVDGDTDSIYTTCPPDEFEQVSKPFYDILKNDIKNTSKHRVRLFPTKVANMSLLGKFILEKEYTIYKALQNKVRLGILKNEELDIVCAGLSDFSKNLYLENSKKDIYKYFNLFDYGLEFYKDVSNNFVYHFFNAEQEKPRKKERTSFQVASDVFSFQKNKKVAKMYNNNLTIKYIFWTGTGFLDLDGEFL